MISFDNIFGNNVINIAQKRKCLNFALKIELEGIRSLFCSNWLHEEQLTKLSRYSKLIIILCNDLVMGSHGLKTKIVDDEWEGLAAGAVLWHQLVRSGNFDGCTTLAYLVSVKKTIMEAT